MIKKWTEDLNRHFFQRRHTDANRYKKRSSTSLIMREIQIKTTVRWPPHTCQKGSYQRHNKCWWGCEEKRTFCAVDASDGYSHYGNSMKAPEKLKIELAYDPAVPNLGICLKEIKSLSGRDICTHITAASFKEPRHGSNLPVHLWMNG